MGIYIGHGYDPETTIAPNAGDVARVWDRRATAARHRIYNEQRAMGNDMIFHCYRKWTTWTPRNIHDGFNHWDGLKGRSMEHVRR